MHPLKNNVNIDLINLINFQYLEQIYRCILNNKNIVVFLQLNFHLKIKKELL